MPLLPDVPEEPDVPLLPDVPDVPSTPDVPEDPEDPSPPDAPSKLTTNEEPLIDPVTVGADIDMFPLPGSYDDTVPCI